MSWSKNLLCLLCAPHVSISHATGELTDQSIVLPCTFKALLFCQSLTHCVVRNSLSVWMLYLLSVHGFWEKKRYPQKVKGRMTFWRKNSLYIYLFSKSNCCLSLFFFFCCCLFVLKSYLMVIRWFSKKKMIFLKWVDSFLCIMISWGKKKKQQQQHWYLSYQISVIIDKRSVYTTG